MSTMKLTADEQAWLDEYRDALAKQFPDVVEEIIIYGSKARGDAGPDSDVDVLVVISSGGRNTKRAVRHLGHMLAVVSDAVPSIMVYTREEWSSRQQSGSPFYQAVMRDGVPVA